MHFKAFSISWFVLILSNLDSVVRVEGETTWVWNTNRSPQNGGGGSSSNNGGGNLGGNSFQTQNPNFGETNIGSSSKGSGGGRGSIFPESPARRKSIVNFYIALQLR
jgi:hypothetical protein